MKCPFFLFHGFRKKSLGAGSEAIESSFTQRRISGTRLWSGTFYRIVPLDGQNGSYVSWAGICDANGANMVINDRQNPRLYQTNGSWQMDNYWAFLETDTPGWYHVINWGYPYKYLTWSKNTTLRASKDQKGFPLVIDRRYPGNHQRNDFLFRPVCADDLHTFQIQSRSLFPAVISESYSDYYGKSRFLKIEKTSFPSFNGARFNESLFSISEPSNLRRVGGILQL